MDRAPMDNAVILARGLGLRMRCDSEADVLSESQRTAAAAGVKAMIPVGRPFLDYVVTALADAGYRRVCLVIGPEHGLIRAYYTATVRPKRISVEFAVQEQAWARPTRSRQPKVLPQIIRSWLSIPIITTLRKHFAASQLGFDGLGGIRP